MMFRFARSALVGIISKLFMSSTLALAEDSIGYKNDVAKIKANLKTGYDSNLYSSSLVEKSALYYQPNVSFLLGTNKETYGIQGTYDYSLFSSDEDKDLVQSHSLITNSYWSPISSNGLLFSTEIKKADERRGTGLTSDDLNPNNQLDSFKYNNILGGYAFERKSGESFLFSFSYALDKKLYNSNRNTALNANLKQKKTNLNLGYKWSKDKKIYISTIKSEQNYPDVTDESKNNTNKISTLGITWPLSSITNISANYGEEKKQFNITNTSFTTNYWSSSLNWSPLSYTQFSLESKNKQEPIDKINQTFSESQELNFAFKYLKTQDHEMVVSIREERKKEIIESNKKIEKNTTYILENNYRDFSLIFEFNKKKKTALKKISEFSISLDYKFKGAL